MSYWLQHTDGFINIWYQQVKLCQETTTNFNRKHIKAAWQWFQNSKSQQQSFSFSYKPRISTSFSKPLELQMIKLFFVHFPAAEHMGWACCWLAGRILSHTEPSGKFGYPTARGQQHLTRGRGGPGRERGPAEPSERREITVTKRATFGWTDYSQLSAVPTPPSLSSSCLWDITTQRRPVLACRSRRPRDLEARGSWP